MFKNVIKLHLLILFFSYASVLPKAPGLGLGSRGMNQGWLKLQNGNYLCITIVNQLFTIQCSDTKPENTWLANVMINGEQSAFALYKDHPYYFLRQQYNERFYVINSLQYDLACDLVKPKLDQQVMLYFDNKAKSLYCVSQDLDEAGEGATLVFIPNNNDQWLLAVLTPEKALYYWHYDQDEDQITLTTDKTKATPLTWEADEGAGAWLAESGANIAKAWGELKSIPGLVVSGGETAFNAGKTAWNWVTGLFH